jgi:hypothetical protein
MSNDSLSTSPGAGPEAAPLAWLLALLREAMVGVMADDTPALKQANALARLGSLYLKTYNTAELKRVNAELEERVAELEERLVALGVDTAAGEEEVAGQPAPAAEASKVASKTGTATPSKPRPNGRPRPGKRPRSKPSPRQKLSAPGS